MIGNSSFKVGLYIRLSRDDGNIVNVNTKMYKKGNLFMYKKRNEIVHLI